MNPSLKKILINRYKGPLVILILLILGIYTFQTISGITSWKTNYTYFNTPAAQKDFDEQLKNSYDFEDEQAGNIFLYYDLKKEHAIYTDNFKEYKDYSLTIFNPITDANQLAYNSYSYYDEHFLFLLVIVMVTGVLLFLYDLKTQFTAALFSSKYRRKDIYWHKMIIVGSTLAGTLLVAKMISLLAYRFFIPSEFLNISLHQQLMSTLSGWLTLITLFVISSFIGMLFGEWLFGIATIGIIYFSFSSFMINLDSIYRTIFVDEAASPMTVDNNILEHALPVVQTSIDKINLVPLLGIVLLASILLFVGSKLFQAISLERMGEAILVPQFSRLLQVFIIFYGMILFSTNIFLLTFFPGDSIPTSYIVFGILKILAWFLGLWFVTEFTLFNKKSKIIRKLSFLDI